MGSGTEVGKMTDLRAYGRVPLRAFVLIEYDAGSGRTEGFCRDVSKGGMYLFSDAPLQPGSNVEVCIAESSESFEPGELIVAYGQVKRSDRHLDGRMGAAVEISRWVRMARPANGFNEGPHKRPV